MPSWDRRFLVRGKEREESGKARLPTPRGGEILPPGASRRRVLWSALIGLPGWALVAFVFWEALKEPTELALPLALWVGFLVLAGLAAFAWSRYARRAAPVERKRAATGRAEGDPVRGPLQTMDALGRKIEVDPGASRARVIVVQVDGETKTVREGS